MAIVLAGDVGGTKTLLRLADTTTSKYGHLPLLLFEASYASNTYEHLTVIVQKFLTTSEASLGYLPQPKTACFGIAGPVVDRTSELTNLGWSLQGDRLAAALGIGRVELINDFAAVGYGIEGLAPQDLHTLQVGESQPHAPIGLIGAGTGLGEGFMIWDGSGYKVYSSEGGHTDFAPRDRLEIDLLQYLLQRHERVSVERVVSGQGIVSIYQFLRDSQFATDEVGLDAIVRDWEQGKQALSPAAAISQAGIEKRDRLAVQTMQMFVRAYGAEAGNLALKLLPYGGLYIAGGVAAKILPLMEQGEFMMAFQQKGRMQPILKDVPVHIILNPEVGLIGSMLYATRACLED
ncbi:glucokinase [Pseudanabaena sp. PCC 6802]|uniref:glucokinase n=1 Tax=Pseudanabaena sp. PCC 6802 TaxID=118173 RepID=UPI00034B86B3|nr:glucokinase [Pseudanabaena sp. PCC 6802]